MPRCSHCRELVSDEQYDQGLGICKIKCGKIPDVLRHRQLQNITVQKNGISSILSISEEDQKEVDALHAKLYGGKQ